MKDIIQYIKEQAPNGVVVGLSGGLDSSVACTLAVKALGKKNVLGVLMPDNNATSQADFKDVVELARQLGIDYRTINMDSVRGHAYNCIPDDKLVRANFTARMRMAILYAHAGSMNRLVLGTSDKSEYLLGFFTKWGDGAADLYPLVNLYKTEVRELAYKLRIPKAIIEKPSSPALWEGQTAEAEIGFSYDDIDSMLKGVKPMHPDIKAMIESTNHKRSSSLVFETRDNQ